ncbi:LamG-like jellyroll fold domain-containing protein [Nonlabens ulvanivorans]|uniref:LamG-like jellyroll fold domain-containing protein n=1 Tax=Nonlabens ulvanivorans TaxID=906888 RepID=UPI0037C6F854
MKLNLLTLICLLFISGVKAIDTSYNSNIIEPKIYAVPDISITSNNVEILDGTTTTSTANNTDFGSIEGPERIYQRFTIKNVGGQELIMSGSNPVTFFGTGGANYHVVEQPTGIIPSGGSLSFFVYVSRPTPGTSTATCTINSNDPDEASYTFEVTSTSTAKKSTFFYENFDSGANGWTGNGTNLNWTVGTTFEKGEGLYFYTDNFNNYPSNARATLVSPTISTSGFTDLEFQLDFRTNTNDANDGMRVEYSANNGITWEVLGSQNSGVNWYNGNDIDALSNNSHGWTGDNSALGSFDSRFENASHELPAILNNNALVKFRIVFASDGDNTIDDGVLVDNIMLRGIPNTIPVAPDGPANVSDDLSLWLRASDIASTDGTQILTWEDLALDNDAKEPAANAPYYVNNVNKNVNFNPAVDFDRASQQHMKGKAGFNSNDYWIVVKSTLDISNSNAGETMVLSAKVSDINPAKDPSGLGWGPVSARYSNEVLAHSVETVPTNLTTNYQGYGRAYSDPTRTFNDVNIINVKNDPLNNSTEIYINGRKVDNANGVTSSSGETLLFNGFLDKAYYLGAGRYQLNGLPYETHLNGQITEVFSYSDRLAVNNQQKIYSYLAIKNGVTLHEPASTLDDHQADWDYVDSDENLIWDYSSNTSYNYDVAAIGRDDNSELNQRQSKSENSTSIIAIGLGDVEDIGTDNLNTFGTDKEFLIWGHNGGDTDTSPTPVAYQVGLTNTVTTTTDKMNRVWKILEVNSDIPTVEIRVHKNDLTGLPAVTADMEYVLLVADDENFSTNFKTLFFEEDGDYYRVKYDFNGVEFFSLGTAAIVYTSRGLEFDGSDDHLNVEKGVDLNNNFTISAWVNSYGDNDRNNAKTILSKRQGGSGYHFYLNRDNRLVMWWNNGSNQSLTSNTALTDNVWRHVAVTYDGTIKLYIDGVLDKETTKTAPITNSNLFTIGARRNNDGSLNNEWKGGLDELRIWNQALTESQLRYIMNQEIQDISNQVEGEILPTTVTKNEVVSIDWDQLSAYYDLNSYIGTALNDNSINKGYAQLFDRDRFSMDLQKAPLPYISTANNDWEDINAWENGSELFTPGSFRNINGATVKIDWNIVKTNHELEINNTDITLLGLIVESDQINVNNDHGLTVTHHLLLDGTIDLKNESQLIQNTDSDLVATSTGKIERDQQGTSDKFSYNYWSSPVSLINSSSINTNFSINDVLKDGTFADTPRDLNWTSTAVRDGAAGNATTAATISGRWLYKYTNLLAGQYSNWTYLGPNGTLKAGEGWTMKGTGASTSNQNYVFVGKPNNGDIDLTVFDGNIYLVGNPYPSALDAHEFINDNPDLDGTIYLWEHWGGNSHQLQLYQGGYAMYNLSGGLGNATIGTSHPSVNQGGIAVKQPERFIPVAQGFFVTGIANGSVRFRNDQRQFVTEASGNSIFVAAPGSNANNNPFSNYNTTSDLRPKFRFGFDSPKLIHRQLLLTIDPNASNGFDRAFDGYQYDPQIDDMSFNLNNEELNIQAIDQVDITTVLPLHVKVGTAGSISIKIDELENVDPSLDIYLKDSLNNTFYNLRNANYVSDPLAVGDYSDRFSIVFNDPTTLGSDSSQLSESDIIIFTPAGQDALHIKKGIQMDINTVTFTNMLGQQINTWNVSDQHGIIKIPVDQIATGNYIVTMQTSYGTQIRKVIIK